MGTAAGLSLKYRILFTLLVTALVWAHLIWDHFNGGVPTHYLLQSEDLPGISNWWGGLTLPLATFLLLFWIHRYLSTGNEQKANESRKKSFLRFIRALVFGIFISVLFTMGSPAPGYMMLLAILISFFVPLYRPEYLLGFILGMSYTFGANLPIMVGLILLLLFLFTYKIIRYGFLHLISNLRIK
ncbi:hypothetical protein [Lentiprolixibacter aurantiacus]|uniref:Uncharacterized protein n=1 Tax=Lentiprolixibacter aurantiacus TaxID=2993939 RepID=A0AAE3SMR9_9FLAO|nr:hypothetical protein [Lentiprolixibacter aurantiacus]MCX2718591.1 hypothetical protein [Lentiprolixibacter aurantiacus]